MLIIDLYLDLSIPPPHCSIYFCFFLSDSHFLKDHMMYLFIVFISYHSLNNTRISILPGKQLFFLLLADKKTLELQPYDR